jgi:cytidylate kinase
MWRDISLANRNNILEAIDYFQEHLKRIRGYIKREEGPALEKEFILSREFRAILKSSEKSKRKKGFIIAIDGPASAGKSTISKVISQALNYTYISTGAIYRAVALKARQVNIAWDDQESLTEVSSSLELQFKTDDQHGVRVYLDGENITGKIKDEEIGKGASAVSAFAGVRKALLDIQRNLGKDGGVVMDGRDIGTVIFPNAEVKFYLDATVEARANRRYKELKETGLNADITAIEQSLRKRDTDDSSRDLAPLSKAPDAIYIDTTKLSIENVKEIMLKEIKGKLF